MEQDHTYRTFAQWVIPASAGAAGSWQNSGWGLDNWAGHGKLLGMTQESTECIK